VCVCECVCECVCVCVSVCVCECVDYKIILRTEQASFTDSAFFNLLLSDIPLCYVLAWK
jgi:hypothetical protein